MVAALRSSDPLRLGPYEIEGRLGEGGQGIVFLGRHAEGGRQYAIKLLHLEADDRAQQRFLREVDTARKVAPFCTARIYDVGTDGDHSFIVSEYVPGPSLQNKVQEDGPLSGAELERLAVGTATALVAIHQAGVIHRDFKPHNVLIGPDGPRVIDFGVAKALSGSTTLTSRVIGTPSYMSPEQVEGDEVSPAADVFCWASTMVYAATGAPPFGQDSIMAVINRIVHHEPDLGGLYGPLRDLIIDCLQKEASDRPTGRDLLMRLLGQAAPAPLGVQDEATEMLNAGAAMAVAQGASATMLDGGAARTTTIRQPAVSPEQWAAANTGLPDAYPAQRRSKGKGVPWFISAAAVSFAMFTAGGAGFVLYKFQSAPTSTPGPSGSESEPPSKGSKSKTPTVETTTIPQQNGKPPLVVTKSPTDKFTSPGSTVDPTGGPIPTHTGPKPTNNPTTDPVTTPPGPGPTTPPPTTDPVVTPTVKPTETAPPVGSSKTPGGPTTTPAA